MRLTIFFLLGVAVVVASAQPPSASRAPRNAAEFDELFQQIKNWGRWGPDDQLGSAKLGIENLKSGIVTRGILIDIPRLKGVPYLEPGTPVYVEDLEAWEKKAGVKVASGDAILLRTGRWARRAALGPWPVSRSAAGFH